MKRIEPSHTTPSAIDPQRLLFLVERKKRLVDDFLEATRTAVEVDIEHDDEKNTAEFLRLVEVRESCITEINAVDRELNGTEPAGAKLSRNDAAALRAGLDRTRQNLLEAARLSRNLEDSLTLVCRRLQDRGTRSVSSARAVAGYGGGTPPPRFLDTRS
ncbi:MAG: hypothetical protein AVO39_10015 [delta proteobacterium MLS_D]|nr:MAG: hypothetical protein AVO39_10015 [delta proteobacterium MLS_D]